MYFTIKIKKNCTFKVHFYWKWVLPITIRHGRGLFNLFINNVFWWHMMVLRKLHVPVEIKFSAKIDKCGNFASNSQEGAGTYALTDGYVFWSIEDRFISDCLLHLFKKQTFKNNWKMRTIIAKNGGKNGRNFILIQRYLSID